MAAFLRTHRRRAGLTLEGLAEQTGLTKSYLSKVERGISTPSIAVALKIARVLDADVGQLFSDSMEGNAMTIVRAKDRVIGPGQLRAVFRLRSDRALTGRKGHAAVRGSSGLGDGSQVHGPHGRGVRVRTFRIRRIRNPRAERCTSTPATACTSTRIRRTGCGRCRRIVRWCWLSSTTSLRLDHPAVTRWKRTAGWADDAGDRHDTDASRGRSDLSFSPCAWESGNTDRWPLRTITSPIRMSTSHTALP